MKTVISDLCGSAFWQDGPIGRGEHPGRNNSVFKRDAVPFSLSLRLLKGWVSRN